MSPCHRPRHPPGEKARPFLWWLPSRFLRRRYLRRSAWTMMMRYPALRRD